MNDNLARQLRFCTTLPTLPAVAIKVIDLANDPNADMIDICRHVALDPALAAKVLRVASSPSYRSRKPPTNLRDAVNLLGTHAAIMVALSFSLANSLMKQSDRGVEATEFWRRSFLAALVCRALANKLGLKKADDLFLAGLLQDVGMLAFDTVQPDAYEKILTADLTHDAVLDAERAVFGSGHDEVGHWLLKRWNLPDTLCHACLAGHRDSTPIASITDNCVAVPDYLADVVLNPGSAICLALAEDIAKCRLGLEGSALIDTLDTVSTELSTVEDLFNISIVLPVEGAALVAEAKELLIIHEPNKLQELEQESQRDALTGAHNRGFFDEVLKREFGLATSQSCPIAMALIEIDYFKAINDNFGHPAGDAVLVAVAHAIQGQIRPNDVLARYDDDEFAGDFASQIAAGIASIVRAIKGEYRRVVATGSWQGDDGDDIDRGGGPHGW